MCYPVCGMMHIKEPLLLIGKNSLCGGSGFPFSLSEWSLTRSLAENRLYCFPWGGVEAVGGGGGGGLGGC